MTFIRDLSPETLWAHFDDILTIPRGSKNEAKMRQFIIDLAEAQELEYQLDATGNVVISKPASAGKEGVPITVLQSHMDMVQEKNSDVDHDFDSDAIQPQQDGEWIKATGTTLGADNGIGIAAMLAVMQSTDVAHGPLEFLFTVDEETGLTGAKQLDAEMLKGRRLINLDSEEEATLCVGCAGGADSEVTLPLTFADTSPEGASLRVRLAGLQGGHSGIDIHLQRGNATQLLARALYAVSLATPFDIASLTGGNAHNAIPREAVAEIVVAHDVREAFVEALASELEAIKREYQTVEPDTMWEISDIESPGRVWTRTTAKRVLRLINALPHGVTMMSNDIRSGRNQHESGHRPAAGTLPGDRPFQPQLGRVGPDGSTAEDPRHGGTERRHGRGRRSPGHRQGLDAIDRGREEGLHHRGLEPAGGGVPVSGWERRETLQRSDGHPKALQGRREHVAQ